jgi:hypothetical protein
MKCHTHQNETADVEDEFKVKKSRNKGKASQLLYGYMAEKCLLCDKLRTDQDLEV